jgi:hypothetical protein
VLTAVGTAPDLFSSSTVASVFSSALGAVGENAAVLVPGAAGDPRKGFVAELVAALAKQLADGAASGTTSLLSPDMLPAIASTAIAVAARNAPALVNGRDPGRQLLAEALGEVLQHLGPQVGSGSPFSRTDVKVLVGDVFTAVARHPEVLLGRPNGARSGTRSATSSRP